MGCKLVQDALRCSCGTALAQLQVYGPEPLLQQLPTRRVLERHLNAATSAGGVTASCSNSGTSSSPASRLGCETCFTFTRPSSRARNAVSGATRYATTMGQP